MSETTQPLPADQANNTPPVLGELSPEAYKELQTSVEEGRERRANMSSRLGEAAFTDEPRTTALHVYEASAGEPRFIVTAGANKGDAINEKGAAKLGLESPSEELEKLKERKDMNKEEWDYFNGLTRIIAGAVEAGTPYEQVDALTEQNYANFNLAARDQYFSPAMKSAVGLFTLGARREPFPGTARLGDVIEHGYLQQSEDEQLLSDNVQEIERFKLMDGFSEESIQQQIVQSVAANVVYRPEGTYSPELTFLLNAYAIGATVHSPQESSYYQEQMRQQVAG